jgi:DNA polymerase-3 subunit gamma/tau
MADHRALNRKYRPQRFSEVVGQDHVTETLASEVKSGTIASAYLFAGPRGTGKTTTARLLAKALNCPDRGDDGEPCGVCTSCVGIAEGSSMDVIELDAASHNKVEDVREIRANVGTVASVGGARRVYILDEAHMLSRAAANALLKTLEEPPEHAHFVLATTEPYKLPDTIRSRTQRFDFRPIGSEALIDHLGEIARRESIEASHEGLALVARHAAGSARDAIGLMEQVAALGGKRVEPKGVTRALGLADADAFSILVKSIAGQDAAAGLALVASLASDGADLRRFLTDSIEFFRGLFLAQYAPNLAEVVDEPAEVLEEWKSHATLLGASDVLRCIDRMGEALVELREGREERLVVELAVLKMTRPETAEDTSSLSARLDRVEDQFRAMKRATPAASNGETAVDRAPAAEQAPVLERPALEPVAIDEPEAESEDDEPSPAAPAPAPAAAPVEGLTLEAVDDAWPAIMAHVREEAGPRRNALFKEARPAAVEGSTLVLEVPDHLPFHLAQLQEDDALAGIVGEAAQRALGGAVRLKYRAGESRGAPQPEAADDTPERAPDKDSLVDSGEGAVNAADLVVDLLGGEVVEE